MFQEQEGQAQCPQPSQLSRKQPERPQHPIPKELSLPILRGERWVVRIGKRSPKWWWLKDKGKSLQKRNKGKSTDRSENFRSNSQAPLLASPVCIGQAQGRKETNIKGGSQEGLRPLLLRWPALRPRECTILCLPVKLSYNWKKILKCSRVSISLLRNSYV